MRGDKVKTAIYAVITYMKINPAEHRDYLGKQGKLFLKFQTQNLFFATLLEAFRN